MEKMSSSDICPLIPLPLIPAARNTSPPPTPTPHPNSPAPPSPLYSPRSVPVFNFLVSICSDHPLNWQIYGGDLDWKGSSAKYRRPTMGDVFLTIIKTISALTPHGGISRRQKLRSPSAENPELSQVLPFLNLA